MLAYLRARATSSGFLGGSRMWIGIGFVVWTIRFFQWLTRAETEVIYRERLGAGQSVIIRQGHPPPNRRQRKKLAKQAKRDARQAKADAKQARSQRRRDAKVARRGGVPDESPVASAA
jgi:hypothetical protein